MEEVLKHSIVNTILKKAIHGLKQDPERTVRNLVDMALQFADSRFQRQFYSVARNLLEDENSGYYDLAKDTLSQIDEESFLTFCMNLGYNGLYRGSIVIRERERNEHFNISWTVFLRITEEGFNKGYHNTIRQGEELGIHSWHLFSTHCLPLCMALARNHPDSAFLIFCESKEINEDVLIDAQCIQNIGFLVSFDQDADMVCDQLRSSGILYGLYFAYTNEDIFNIESGEMLLEMEQLHPVFAVFMPQFPCLPDIRARAYNAIGKARMFQKYKMIPWELYGDTLMIDGVISGQAVWVCFDGDGQLNTVQGEKRLPEINIFDNDLPTILKEAFPKSERDSLCN